MILKSLPLLLTGLILILGHPAMAQQGAKTEGKYQNVWELLKDKHDKNQDGKITPDEYKRGEEKFKIHDKNKDGVISALDYPADGSKNRDRSTRRGRGRDRRGRGDGNREDRDRPGRKSNSSLPQPGDIAPDFRLPYSHDSKVTVKLSSFAGKRPVALIFGSYT